MDKDGALELVSDFRDQLLAAVLERNRLVPQILQGFQARVVHIGSVGLARMPVQAGRRQKCRISNRLQLSSPSGGKESSQHR